MIGNSKISDYLLNNGAEINAIDKENNTPLHEAARKGRLNVVQVLLAHGADATIKGYNGETPAEKASTDEIRIAITDYLSEKEKQTEDQENQEQEEEKNENTEKAPEQQN